MRFKLNYSGGGLLIATRDTEGRLHVLLGKRCHHPGKGLWSFPGGECQRAERRKRRMLGFAIYSESCCEAALREADEEIRLWRGAPPLPSVNGVKHLWGLGTVLFNWSTYGWLVENPELEEATSPGSVPHEELYPVRWFPADGLPDDVHWGVRQAVRRAVGRFGMEWQREEHSLFRQRSDFLLQEQRENSAMH